MNASLLRVVSLAAAIASGVAIVPALIFPFVSLFLFDSPDAPRHASTYLMLVLLWSVPALLALALVVAVKGIVAPTGRAIAAALGLLAVPGLVALMFFDPLHFRHYPPPQECFDTQYVEPTGHVRRRPLGTQGKWICRPMPRAHGN